MARVPLHESISADLRGRITDRELTPGDLLPSESALQAEYSVSRSVVRQALATLESEGLVRRAQGRGTIVAPQGEPPRAVDVSSGLMSQLMSAGTRTTTRVLRFAPAPTPQHVQGLGDETVVLERLRSVDGRPVAFIRTYLAQSVGDALDAGGLEDHSLHQAVLEATGRRVADGRRAVRAVAAAPPLDRHLGVPSGAPLLLLEGTSVDQHGEVIESFATWHRSDVVAFDLGLHGPTPSAELDRVTALADELAAELRRLRG